MVTATLNAYTQPLASAVRMASPSISIRQNNANAPETMWGEYQAMPSHHTPAPPPGHSESAQPPSNLLNDAAATRHVLIADDHALLRFGLRSLLDDGRGTIAFHEAGNLADAIDTYRANPNIELVLLDLNMTDCRGLQGVQQFISAFPKARVAILSATQDEFVIKQAEALGAVAYIAKTHAPQTLSQMILALLRLDGTPIGGASEPGLNGFAKRGRSASYDRVAELGTRHLEILDLILFGCSNQEISNATTLSLGTVKNYVSTILLALDVKSRSHLISVFR
jgi:DNA-binding NarL/FixJ family response regulator